jgi:acyl-CoA synthetase (AMP-forming)/AMP-acid ligase II
MGDSPLSCHLSAAPNFAYELCASKSARNLLRAGPELLASGFQRAEPVSPDTIDRFTQRFAAYGFRPETLLPVTDWLSLRLL